MLDRALWIPPFDLAKFPRWPCPACNRGRLVAVGKSFRASHDRSAPECPDSFPVTFSLAVQCDELGCGQHVAVSGTGEASHTYGPEPGFETIEVFDLTPRAVWPAPSLFGGGGRNLLGWSYEHVHRASALYWVDPGAAVACIRTGVESLLDALGVPREGVYKDGAPRRRGLGERISLAARDYPRAKSALEAMREIGNEGAHGTEVTFSGAFGAFELLENALTKVFSQHRTIDELLDDHA